MFSRYSKLISNPSYILKFRLEQFENRSAARFFSAAIPNIPPSSPSPASSTSSTPGAAAPTVSGVAAHSISAGLASRLLVRPAYNEPPPKNTRWEQFLVYPAFLVFMFYVGTAAEPILNYLDQLYGDKDTFDLGFSQVEAEGQLLAEEVQRRGTRHLELWQVQSGAAFHRVLDSLERCPTIRSLSLVNACRLDADRLLLALQHAPHTRNIKLRGGDLGASVPLLRALSANTLPHVEQLSLHQAEVDPLMVHLLLQLVQDNQSLKALSVRVRLLNHADGGRSIIKVLKSRLRETRPDMSIECRVVK